MVYLKPDHYQLQAFKNLNLKLPLSIQHILPVQLKPSDSPAVGNYSIVLAWAICALFTQTQVVYAGAILPFWPSFKFSWLIIVIYFHPPWSSTPPAFQRTCSAKSWPWLAVSLYLCHPEVLQMNWWRAQAPLLGNLTWYILPLSSREPGCFPAIMLPLFCSTDVPSQVTNHASSTYSPMDLSLF